MVSKEDIEFQQEPDMDVTCPICLHVVMDNPRQTLCCGRHFCGACISRAKRCCLNHRCPNCRGECKTFPDKNFERTIGSKVVYCRKGGKKTEKCCNWRGELKNYREHTSTDCPYEKVECCSQCTEPRLRINIEECPFRPYNCQYCGLMRETYTFITNFHYKECFQYPIGCNQCSDKNVTRAGYEAHKNKCPMEPVKCVYSWLGCKEMPRRKNAEKHYSDAHHQLLSKVYKELREETNQMKSDLKELVECELNRRQGSRLIVEQNPMEEAVLKKKLIASINQKYSDLQQDHKRLSDDFDQSKAEHNELLHELVALKNRYNKMLHCVKIVAITVIGVAMMAMTYLYVNIYFTAVVFALLLCFYIHID